MILLIFFYLVFNAYICIAKQKFFLLTVVLYNIIRKVKVRLPTSGVDYYIVFAKLASESQFVLVSHDRSLREWETFFCFLLLTSHYSDNNDLFLSSCHIIISLHFLFEMKGESVDNSNCYSLLMTSLRSSSSILR